MTIRTSDNGSHFGSRFQSESANTNFGARLKYLRERMGLSQADLASKLTVGKNTIQRYEAGDYPKGDYLLKISKLFGCSIDWLLVGDQEAQRTDDNTQSKEPPVQQPQKNLVVLQHMDIVQQFKDSELAKIANQDLIEIEKLNPLAFREVAAYIKGVANGLKYAESVKAPQGDRRHDQRRTHNDQEAIPEDGDRRQGKSRRAVNGD